ncbi:MAG: carboxypeptidase-like regulatory domain-containing protein [Flavobacteriales bacterium]|jgi:hypothetical protein|nr:carboxypeptidase-like regulatory domain-containing protein [Flavobacteriales bacterium]MDP4716471.1 carboxypeptidase-like regulatory domain-containing protein [Flavobacteriales bacterium]MDP4730532.1 carboxypeptidase-like regulatory domain-containing protein [Flavobacteriales bacterium]MDP4819110.1 carboxypeptidase-like regulatory domain-containing protein [Flavobacteriales bacterium]MDP4950419.1 carboxypeptidase-like regulatory domain-containing protein [Flavobacteriales bacterium]
MKNFFAVLFLVIVSHTISAQGTLRGKVTDEKGESMFGVIVRAIENEAIIAQTDFEGTFSLKFPDNKSYTLNFIIVGYEKLEEKIQLKDNAVLSKEFTLINSSNIITGMDVVARRTKANDGYMEKMKMNSATTLDFISAEVMKKTGDANVVNAIARVSGVSTNGGLITVRGIGDRYVRTTLNGSRIPTLDPLTNNIKLDIFPSSLVDNIVITKTQSADLPGDWAGAYISVETKDYPDKLSVNIESQFGYNAQTTFKNFITSDRSSTDWLGFDNGLRIRENENLTVPNLDPSTYQQMVALGLGDYFAQQGIHGWSDGDAQGDAYFRLGLVQLGLLPAAQFNDPTAFANARDQYNSTYKPQAFNTINPNGTSYANGFSNNWNTRYRRAPINFSQSFSVGDQKTLFGRELGFIFGFKYGSAIRFDPNGISQRVGDESLGYLFDRQDSAKISRETNSISALINVAYKLNKNNKISLLFMPNIIGNNDVASFEEMPEGVLFQEAAVSKNIFYEQRKQFVYQYSSQHYIPSLKLKLDLNASYTDGSSIAPDFKATQYIQFLDYSTVTGYQFAPTAGDGIRRFDRYLDENIFDGRIGFEMPIKSKIEGAARKIKFGAATQRNYRKIDNNEYRLFTGNPISVDPLLDGDLDSYLSLDKFVMQDGILGYYYADFDFERNHSFGNSNVEALYALVDFELNQSLRFSGGARVEHTDIFTDADKFYEEGYGLNDIRRENVGGFALVNAASIDQWDVLPSGSLIYKLKTKSEAQSNLRFNYSQSVARPSIRELSDAAIFDNEFRTVIYGNSDLKMTRISNYDFRGEVYFQNGDNVSASVFYKDFRNHIEMGFGGAGITWDNIEQSTVRGIEVEGKKQIGRNFEFRANLTLVKSEAEFVRKDLQIVEGIKVYTILDTLYRPMFGQAPYLFNSILSYTADSLGLTATISYNVQGPRLVIAGAVKGRPDVYEIPRHLLDFKISKTLGEHYSASITVRDILNSPVRRAYDLPTGYVDFDRFRYGTNFLVSFAYKL